MSYVKTINEDGVVSDIMAKALDPELDAAVLKRTNLVNGFTQTEAGVNALDAAAGKSLNDSLSNTQSTVAGIQSDVTDINTVLDSTVKRTHGVTLIPDNSDINNYLTEGEYYVPGNASARTMANLPEDAGGRLVVEHSLDPSNIYLIQTYVTYETNMYTRYYDYNGVWSGWKELATITGHGAAVVYRDLTIDPSTAIAIAANGSTYFTNYTTPSVSGYTCVAVSVINQNGASGGYCVFMPRLGANGITIHNNSGSAASITRLQLRYVFIKN